MTLPACLIDNQPSLTGVDIRDFERQLMLRSGVYTGTFE